MKKIISLFLAVILMCSMLFGCGSAKNSNVELTLWTPPVFNVGYLDALKELVAEYEETHKNVKITIVELNWDGIGEKLETAMMTESTPDIYIDGTARTAKLPSTILVVDVTDVINGLDGWNESATAIGKIDGKNYLVPLTQMPPTNFGINVSLVKEYGLYDLLPEDRVSWTWDDFMNFIEKVGEKSISDGVYPVGLYAGSQSSDITYYTMMLSAGASILNDTHNASAVNSKEAVSVINKLKEINDKGLAYPGVETLTDDDILGLFYGGKVVINPVEGALTDLPVLQGMKEQGLISEVPEIESYAWPTLNGSKTVIGNWGANCIAIFKNKNDEKKIAAAKDFLTYMLSDKEFSETLWSCAPSYAPARNFGQELKVDDAQILREAEANSNFSTYCTSQFGILESYWGEIRQYFYPELQSMFLGKESAEDVIKNFDTNINQVLNSK